MTKFSFNAPTHDQMLGAIMIFVNKFGGRDKSITFSFEEAERALTENVNGKVQSSFDEDKKTVTIKIIPGVMN